MRYAFPVWQLSTPKRQGTMSQVPPLTALLGPRGRSWVNTHVGWPPKPPKASFTDARKPGLTEVRAFQVFLVQMPLLRQLLQASQMASNLRHAELLNAFDVGHLHAPLLSGARCCDASTITLPNSEE